MFCCCQNVVRKVSKVFLASVFSISSLLLFPAAANAQSPQQVTQITRTLSADSQKVIERLGSFRPVARGAVEIPCRRPASWRGG